MVGYFITLLALGALFGAVLFLASKNGSKAAQLEILKAELKKQAREQARAQRIIDKVSYLPAADAKRRLHDVARQQR